MTILVNSKWLPPPPWEGGSAFGKALVHRMGCASGIAAAGRTGAGLAVEVLHEGGRLRLRDADAGASPADAGGLGEVDLQPLALAVHARPCVWGAGGGGTCRHTVKTIGIIIVVHRFVLFSGKPVGKIQQTNLLGRKNKCQIPKAHFSGLRYCGNRRAWENGGKWPNPNPYPNTVEKKRIICKIGPVFLHDYLVAKRGDNCVAFGGRFESKILMVRAIKRGKRNLFKPKKTNDNNNRKLCQTAVIVLMGWKKESSAN